MCAILQLLKKEDEITFPTSPEQQIRMMDYGPRGCENLRGKLSLFKMMLLFLPPQFVVRIRRGWFLPMCTLIQKGWRSYMVDYVREKMGP